MDRSIRRRAKIPITWIKSDASRQVTFTKRKKGLKKKVEELAILCGVDVCMICFGPQVAGLKPAATPPFSWGLPSVHQVINKYRSLSKEEQDKKKLDNVSLLEQQIKKLKADLKLRIEQNRLLEREHGYFLWDNRLNGLGVDDLKQLADMVLEHTRLACDRLAFLYQRGHPNSMLGQEMARGTCSSHAVGEYDYDALSNQFMASEQLVSESGYNVNANHLVSLPNLNQRQAEFNLTCAHNTVHLSTTSVEDMQNSDTPFDDNIGPPRSRSLQDIMESQFLSDTMWQHSVVGLQAVPDCGPTIRPDLLDSQATAPLRYSEQMHSGDEHMQNYDHEEGNSVHAFHVNGDENGVHVNERRAIGLQLGMMRRGQAQLWEGCREAHLQSVWLNDNGDAKGNPCHIENSGEQSAAVFDDIVASIKADLLKRHIQTDL